MFIITMPFDSLLTAPTLALVKFSDDERFRELERQLGSLQTADAPSQEQLLALQQSIDARTKQVHEICRDFFVALGEFISAAPS